MHKYKVKIEFHMNHYREKVKNLELVYQLDVKTNYGFRQGKMFVAELFKELAYGEAEKVMLANSMACGSLPYFDYILLDKMFKLNSIELSQELMEQFEIKSIMVFNSIGEKVAFFNNLKLIKHGFH